MKPPSTVYLTDGTGEEFHKVTILDSGWVSCWAYRAGGKVNVKYPPFAVERVETGYSSVDGLVGGQINAP